jgi:signal transduction histidine kinase
MGEGRPERHAGPSWRGGRPPWWPEGEPFPPDGGWDVWGGMRRRFVRRLVLGAAALLLLFVVSGWLLGAIVGGGGEPGRHGGPPRFFPFPIFGFVGLAVVLVFVLRGVRRAAGPVGDVMEAVGRVAEGDLSVRVEPRGGGDDRRLSQAFNRMAERLETDEARRRELLADLAHELRTPLAVIRGNAEAMLDGVYPADPQHLRTVLDETDILGRLLDDLRILSTAEAGALVLHRASVAPSTLIDEAVAAFTAAAEERNVTLVADVADGLPDVDVDHVRIGEVLANLLQNALRHSPDGGTIEVAAHKVSLDDAPGVAVRVSDDGPGIPPELLPHVFDRFVKSADSGGSGLGLAIARSLVEVHGGAINASSRTERDDEAPRGTTIMFTLPADPRRSATSGG